MSTEYYRAVDRRTSRAYEMGREFEYRVMGLLRRHGWHCMRRFGSQGVIWCARCHNHLRRPKKGKKMHCSRCKTGKYAVKVSLDVTAYKNGVYLMITCKFSEKHATMYVDDQYWENMVLYAHHHDAIPVFAGITDKGYTYLVDLRTKTDLESWTYRYKRWVRPKDDAVARLMKEAWDVVDRCNLVLGQMMVECPKCKKQFQIPDVTDLEDKKKARWTEVKLKMVNVLNKLLWRSGATATQDDLAQILEIAEKEMEKEKKNGKNK